MTSPAFLTLFHGALRGDAAWLAALAGALEDSTGEAQATRYSTGENRSRTVGTTSWENAVTATSVQGIEQKFCDFFLPAGSDCVQGAIPVVSDNLEFLSANAELTLASFTWGSGEGLDPFIVLSQDQTFTESATTIFESTPSSQPFAEAIFGPRRTPILRSHSLRSCGVSLFIFTPSVAQWQSVLDVIGRIDCIVDSSRLDSELLSSEVSQRSWQNSLTTAREMLNEKVRLTLTDASVASEITKWTPFDSFNSLIVPHDSPMDEVASYLEFAESHDAWYDSEFALLPWTASTGRGAWEQVTLICHDPDLTQVFHQNLTDATAIF